MDTTRGPVLRMRRPRRPGVEALARRGERVGLDGALAGLDRTAVPCAVPGAAVDGPGYTWAPQDADDPAWTPQGVATTRDGDVLLVAWYARRRALVRTEGARVSVVDLRDPEHVRYAHVRLVRPRRWLPGLRRVAVHAGGLAVVGDLLYVADTLGGVRVFHLADVVRLAAGGDGAGGARYVLPELLRLRQPVRPSRALRWSFLGVGDVGGEPSLVAGEYGRRGTRPRLVRYRLDAGTGLPVRGPDGRSHPVEVHLDQPHRMQGVAVHGDTWVVTASAGEGKPGDLYVGAPGAFHRHRGVLPTGPEDIDWARPGERAWCATEWPGRRWIFAVDVARWARPRLSPAGPPGSPASR